MRLLQPDSVWSQDAVKVFAGAEDDVQDEVIRVSGVVDDGGHRHICGDGLQPSLLIEEFDPIWSDHREQM